MRADGVEYPVGFANSGGLVFVQEPDAVNDRTR
jgi:hypothetical protein